MIKTPGTPMVVLLAALTALVAAARAARADEPFDYFQNSWNVIGLKDYKDATRITPDNALLLGGSRKLYIRFGRDLARLSREQTKTLVDGWQPVILLTARDGDVRYEFTLWASPLPTVKDWKAAFDWPTEGEDFLNWIDVNVTNGGSSPAPARLRCDVAGEPAPIVAPLDRTLDAGAAVRYVVRIPSAPARESAAVGTDSDAKLWLDRTLTYWRSLMAGAARIQTPCEKTNHALLADHVCQLIAGDHGELHGGEGFYDEFYIRDGAYQIMELEEAGLWDSVRKALVSYLNSQLPDGRFETQKGQFDANGQAVWVLWQYWKISGDNEWLAKAYPPMRKAVDWTMKARREAPADSPFVGLLPAAVADGEFLWDGKHHIVGYDLWNLRAVLCAADAARAMGNADEADELEKEAAAYRTAIDAACRRAGNGYFPASWENAGTFWGNTETLWPTELFPADDPRVAGTVEFARRSLGGGFIEGTIRWMGAPDAIHPYMSAYTTMASLIVGDAEQVVEDYFWYLLHSTAAHAFPEGIFYKRRFAWSDTIPHCTGAANHALMLRHMLLHERGDDLHLLPAVPDWWLAEGREIRIERAPTWFGELDLRVTGRADGVKLEFRPPSRRQPRRIVLHMPDSRPIVGSRDGIEIAPRPGQKTRWDFAAVVARYGKIAAPLVKRLPDLIDLPLITPLDASACRLLDLSKVANTNPLTAPFGVASPGKHVFAGMPVGMQTAGGVPFHILDPASNSDRGFVVLHSDKAPTDRPWPREVEIAVNATGKAVYFLGNVTGWAADDPGTGPHNAVAEYVIHYADGPTQVVPLITGRTIEDWTAAPHASDVFCGLKGDPWHLNVLGVRLRPAEVSKIVFRDLGTRAAPVLVAVTLAQ